MTLNINPLMTADLTEAIPAGNGVFDTLMRAAKGHLEQEYDQNRIRAADYSQVYLGAMTAILQNSVMFLLQKDKASQDALLIQEQIKLAVLQQELLQKQIDQADKDAALKAAQTLKVIQETHNLVNADLQTIAQTDTIKQQKLNLITENATMVKQQLKLDADTNLVKQNTANAVIEGDNLSKQGCLLAAQYDLTMTNNLQAVAQTTLIQQKTATEKAQTVATGVDDNSVVGKQKLLYAAQTNGFTRDAEQKAAKLLVDTWNVRRTTDDATVADNNNMLNDVTIGRAVNKVLQGVGA
jgi:hypothetical protein